VIRRLPVAAAGMDRRGRQQHGVADIHAGFMWRPDTAAMKLPSAFKVAFEWIAYIAVSAILLLLVFAD
jgi:hypothetical protein